MPQPIFIAAENLVFGRKQTRKRDNKVYLLVENTWTSLQLLFGHCLPILIQWPDVSQPVLK